MPGGAGYLTQGQYGPPQGYAQQLPGNPEPARAPNPFPQGLGYDPAKPPVVESKKFNTRVELPAEAYMDGPRVSLSIINTVFSCCCCFCCYLSLILGYDGVLKSQAVTWYLLEDYKYCWCCCQLH